MCRPAPTRGLGRHRIGGSGGEGHGACPPWSAPRRPLVFLRPENGEVGIQGRDMCCCVGRPCGLHGPAELEAETTTVAWL